MAKIKKVRGVHTAVVLPPDMLERLRQSERGVSEEIRQRLALTFEADAYDPQTRELATDIMHIADDVSRLSGVPWHSNPRAHEALTVAITTWLENQKPPYQGAATDLFVPGDPPTLGRSVAKLYERLKAVREKTAKEITALLRRGKS